MLHTVNKSPFSHTALAECLRFCDADAAVLLIEDGVYAALADSRWSGELDASPARIYALAPDVIARGLDGRVAGHITLVDYAGFVQLCCAHSTVQSWY